MIAINYVAILVAALANFIIGAIFHMPPVGTLWMKLANIKPPKDGKMPSMASPMVKNYIANVIFACGLAIVYFLISTSSALSGPGILAGVYSALLVWFFFIATSSSMDAIWGLGMSWKLWMYEAGVSLLSCLAMGVIIASM